jgi:hypothetical protein
LVDKYTPMKKILKKLSNLTFKNKGKTREYSPKLKNNLLEKVIEMERLYKKKKSKKLKEKIKKKQTTEVIHTNTEETFKIEFHRDHLLLNYNDELFLIDTGCKYINNNIYSSSQYMQQPKIDKNSKYRSYIIKHASYKHQKHI